MVVCKEEVVFECASGWHSICDNMIEELDNLPSRITILQIKEKFGDLVVYWMDAYSPEKQEEEVENIIQKYCQIAENTCEICGSTDNIQKTKTGWITRLCSKCREERGYK